MFNKELKERFIKNYTTSISLRKFCISVFSETEKYENEWGEDLCTRTAKELSKMLEDISSGIRRVSKTNKPRVLRDYVTWCLKNNIPGACDGMFNVKISGIDKLKLQTVTSPLHLELYLNQVYELESEKTIDNTFRCFYWLAYAGMKECDIIKITPENVDFSNMVIKYNNNEYPIYREAIQSLKNCIELTRFIYKHPNYTTDMVVYKDRAEGNEIIRGIRSLPTILSLRSELSRRSKKALENNKTDLKLNYYKVWLSGMFYRMYEREISGFPVDFSSMADDLIKGKTYNFNSEHNTVEKYRKTVEREYLKDYNQWKLTLIK